MRNVDPIDTLCSTGDGVFIVDENRHIIRWNKPAEVILKYSEQDVLNRKCYQVFSGKTSTDTVHCQPNCRVLRKVEKSSQKNFDVKTQTKDGKVLWLNVSIISPVIAGKRYIAHILRDISKTKKMESGVNSLLSALGVHDQYRTSSGLEDRTADSFPDKVQHAPGVATETLSDREMEVLLLLAEGFSTKNLSRELSISQFTARNHIQNILVKLGLHSKAQAVSYAFKKGLL